MHGRKNILNSALLVLALAGGSVAHGQDSKPAGDWGKFYKSLRAVQIKPGSIVELKAGDAVRFEGVANEWCGEKNSGIEVVEGNGALHDANPMTEVKRMNKGGSYGSARLLGLDATSFFVATYTPTRIKLLSTGWQKLGQECGE